MSYLDLKNIHKSYYLGKEEFPVLNGINLSFELGESVAILGESGGGKSTLMNIIGGLDREFTGQVIVNGQKLDHKNEKAMNSYRRETIGYIYQSYNLIAHLTVTDNVLMSLDMTTLNKQQRLDRARQLLTQVGLENQLTKYPSQLSGGQKQRVAIARALASDPKVIIADEPTGALDSQNTKEVLEILNGIASEGRLVITVTHSETVANNATRIVHLVDGRIDGDKRLRDAAIPLSAPSEIKSRLLPFNVSFRSALKHLKFNFWRNSLIVIGTAIGLFAVMLFSGLGNGIGSYIADQVTSVANPQVTNVSRYVKSTTSSTPPAASTGMPTQTTNTLTATPTFSKKQIKQIENLKHITKVERSYTASNATIKYNNKSVSSVTVPNYTNSQTKSSLKYGTKPGKGEIVLDESSVAKKFSKKNWKKLIGKKVTVSYTTLNSKNRTVKVHFTATVSGIANNSTSVATISGADVNTNTLVTAMKDANVDTAPSTLTVKVDNLNNVKKVTKQINKLKNSDNKRLYSSTSVASMIDRIQTYVNLASTVLAAIAAIALIVSALMIIVTMYMSVSARTKEIGILRALGESKGNIRQLFISESLIIGLISATLATLLAEVIAKVANLFLQNIANYSFVQISTQNIVIVFVLALIISLIAAVLPARHAANLNPIDALSAD
ncbi:ABC transporter ATP-binding protein [Lactiplantibacillus fabifermentans T30PCM01]|uniref:ABC transporter ATP-binding protein n=1 Tax=Lactiplantibacillus fabifermentans T30PCM01 TaxID=1400520 RepID=W6TCE8_9LACO|nr:ABC transporter ATP-binding protein/permease [Lactiplantibacillus fabifermentans]ETY74265.1 ABC transporter ATP-binding protein [Lactiplantibacillus fabifermentans T30PCM01]